MAASMSISILKPICSHFSSFSSRNFLTSRSQQWSRQLLAPSAWRCMPQSSSARGMAGHSKWQNIRHVKAATDLARAKTFMKLARMMKAAIRDGNSNDPKFNTKLAHAVDQARRVSMPTSKIESILKEKEVSKELLVPFTLEAKGPGGCFLILEGLTDNFRRTRQTAKSYMNKVGGFMLLENGPKHLFDHKGILCVDPIKTGLNLEKAVEIAIEVGAEDVIQVTEEDGTNILQFSCEPNDFYTVRKQLTEKGFELLSSEVTYIANTKVDLDEDQLARVDRLNDFLDEDQDIMKCYDNIN